MLFSFIPTVFSSNVPRRSEIGLVARRALEEAGAIPQEYGYESRKKIHDLITAFAKQQHRGKQEGQEEGGGVKGRRNSSSRAASGIKRKSTQGQTEVETCGDGMDQTGDRAKAPKLSSAGPSSGPTKAPIIVGGLNDQAEDNGGRDKEPLAPSNAPAETMQDHGKGGRDAPPAVSAAGRGSRAPAAPPRGADEWRRVMLSYPQVSTEGPGRLLLCRGTLFPIVWMPTLSCPCCTCPRPSVQGTDLPSNDEVALTLRRNGLPDRADVGSNALRCLLWIDFRQDRISEISRESRDVLHQMSCSFISYYHYVPLTGRQQMLTQRCGTSGHGRASAAFLG